MKVEVARQTYPFSLPDLPYAYEALEPHLDAATLRIHHDEHHATYVKKLNEALANDTALHSLTLTQLLAQADQLPEAIRAAVVNNGGGHFNHSLFWQSMAPAASTAPRGALATALGQQFGSIDAFRTKFSEAATKHFASGWVALSHERAGGKLLVVDLKDHEVVKGDATPILILDVWEHAYYLKFQQRRPKFIEAFWNVVDWNHAEDRFANGPATSGL